MVCGASILRRSFTMGQLLRYKTFGRNTIEGNNSWFYFTRYKIDTTGSDRQTQYVTQKRILKSKNIF